MYLLHLQGPPLHCRLLLNPPSPPPLLYMGHWPPHSAGICPYDGPFSPSPGSKQTHTKQNSPGNKDPQMQKRNRNNLIAWACTKSVNDFTLSASHGATRAHKLPPCLPISFYAAAESHPVSAASCNWSRSSCTVTRFLIPPSWRWRTNSYHTGEGLELTDGQAEGLG